MLPNITSVPYPAHNGGAGKNLHAIALVGEYVARIYDEVKQ